MKAALLLDLVVEMLRHDIVPIVLSMLEEKSLDGGNIVDNPEQPTTSKNQRTRSYSGRRRIDGVELKLLRTAFPKLITND